MELGIAGVDALAVGSGVGARVVPAPVADDAVLGPGGGVSSVALGRRETPEGGRSSYYLAIIMACTLTYSMCVANTV